MFCGDDTVVVKFVDTAIVGKSEAEDACHHGLVEPTINMKEAMNAINSMFSEPLETAPVGRPLKRLPKNDANRNNEFPVWMSKTRIDQGLERILLFVGLLGLLFWMSQRWKMLVAMAWLTPQST